MHIDGRVVVGGFSAVFCTPFCFSTGQIYFQEERRMERFSAKSVDELGRVLIPMELRQKLGWTERVALSMYFADNNTLIIQRKDFAPNAETTITEERSTP